jgi:hypothetical protein
VAWESLGDMLTTTAIDELSARAGTELGVSDDVFISRDG